MLEGVLKPCLHRVDKPTVMLQYCCCKSFCKQYCCSFNCKMICHCYVQTIPQICMCTALESADCVSACYVSHTRVDLEERFLSSAGALANHSAFTSAGLDCRLSKQHRKSVWNGAIASLLHLERGLEDRGPFCLETCSDGRSKLNRSAQYEESMAVN